MMAHESVVALFSGFLRVDGGGIPGLFGPSQTACTLSIALLRVKVTFLHVSARGVGGRQQR